MCSVFNTCGCIDVSRYWTIHIDTWLVWVPSPEAAVRVYRYRKHRDTSWIMREIHSNTYDRYIQIHMLDALSRHTVKSGLTRGIVYLLRIQCGINVFLRKSSAAWYRLQNTSWHKSEGGAREGLLFLDVSWMYFVCILTSPQQRAWRCGDTWIIHGSCMDHIIHQNLWWDTCGIRPKNILIRDQIHVSVRG